MVRVEMVTAVSPRRRNEVNQEESEQNAVGGTKKGADSTSSHI